MEAQLSQEPVIHSFPDYQRELLRGNQNGKKLDGTGWIVLADRNTFGNKVLLVGEKEDKVAIFRHTEPYHDHLRAYQRASVYAQEHPL